MYATLDFGLSSCAEKRRAILCVALVAALLYNPFLTILSNSLEISLQHPLSYRATVASSELQRCTLETETPLIPALGAMLFLALAGLALSHEVGLIEPSDLAVPAFTAASDGIWFRPPPVA